MQKCNEFNRFCDNLKISLEDLKYSGTNGFVDGVTNIFTKKLKDMDPTERPIHCSDKKDCNSM